MAIAVEASSKVSATSALSVTVPNITPAGSDRHVIGFGGNTAGAVSNYSDMTFGGNAMTPKVNQVNNPYGPRVVAEELVAPAASAQGLVYTVSATQDVVFGFVIALSGVDQTTPTDTYQFTIADTGDPMSVSVTVPSGDLGVGYGQSISSTIASGDTQQQDIDGAAGTDSANMATAPGSDTAMTWTRTGIGLNDHGAIAVNVNAAAGGAAGHPTMRRWGGIPGMNQYSGRGGW